MSYKGGLNVNLITYKTFLFSMNEFRIDDRHYVCLSMVSGPFVEEYSLLSAGDLFYGLLLSLTFTLNFRSIGQPPSSDVIGTGQCTSNLVYLRRTDQR